MTPGDKVVSAVVVAGGLGPGEDADGGSGDGTGGEQGGGIRGGCGYRVLGGSIL